MKARVLVVAGVLSVVLCAIGAGPLPAQTAASSDTANEQLRPVPPELRQGHQGILNLGNPVSPKRDEAAPRHVVQRPRTLPRYPTEQSSDAVY
jgi:hypothetical protein